MQTASSAKPTKQSVASPGPARDSAASTTTAIENPWADVSGQASSSLTRKKNTVVISKSTSVKDKALDALNKRKSSKSVHGKQRTIDDAVVDIETGNLGAGSTRPNLPLDNDSEAEEVDPEQASTQRGPRAFDQRDLVAQAFAGDNVIEVSLERSQAEFGLLLILHAIFPYYRNSPRKRNVP